VAVESLLGRVDQVIRRLQRDLECCDRVLVNCCGLTVAQSYALLALQELGTATMNEFAVEMRLHGTTMTRMADALVDKGLVERKPDPEDRRVVRVSLSTVGREVAGRLQESKRSLLSSALTDLPAGERGKVIEALEQMAEVLERLSGQWCG
jgi:MarR family transcriptional regulator, organic hydroperoxide resistance regulator